MYVQLQRAHSLRTVDKKKASMAMSQFAQRPKVSTNSSRVANPIESQNSCSRSKRGGHLFNSHRAVHRFHNVHLDAVPAKMKPCEEVGRKIAGPDNDIVARF